MLFTAMVINIINIDMKIGFFDSGLGGLYIARAVHKMLPQYDYVYLGDTLHLPYGKRSRDTVYQLTQRAVEYLFTQQDCQLIIIACNTASALALRKLQQGWLATHYPERRVLGVIVPTLEHTIEHNHKNIGMIATEAMASSGIYEEELRKLSPDIALHSVSAPLLVPLLEHEGDAFLDQALSMYIEPLVTKNIDALILGCTHYCLLKSRIERLYPNRFDIIAQDEIIPPKITDYLRRHPEIDGLLSKGHSSHYEVTDISQSFQKNAHDIIGDNVDIALARYV